MRGSKVIIDWHNLGYSILALRLGKSHPLVDIARRFEHYFGRSAYAHLFVTNAMKEFLVQSWDLKYDFHHYHGPLAHWPLEAN